ncbi:MAG: DivIVA domain-containing protein [Bacilli bacterium]|jgi:DivIVA domain-containing protein|nr:DivIVA domain-containing protein [Bacilli bacterium]
MPIALKLDSNKILHKQFEGTKPGYNCLQVDSFLDTVISDYETMEKYAAESERKIEELKSLNDMLNKRLTKEEADLAVMSEKLKNISDNDNASLSNLDLLKRISALEQALFKQGVDPNTVE